MSRETTGLDPGLRDYLLEVSLREHEVMRRAREETAEHPLARMQIAPEQAQLMANLVRLMGARRAIEVGVFTGYSALAVALALPDDGLLVAIDSSEEHTAAARRYFAAAGVEHKISLRVADALGELDRLLLEGREGTFDFAFLDADKSELREYYERALRLVRPGGAIAVDNVLWHGKVADPAASDDETRAIRAFNAFLRADRRIDLSLVPIGDGLSLAVKR